MWDAGAARSCLLTVVRGGGRTWWVLIDQQEFVVRDVSREKVRRMQHGVVSDCFAPGPRREGGGSRLQFFCPATRKGATPRGGDGKPAVTGTVRGAGADDWVDRLWECSRVERARLTGKRIVLKFSGIPHNLAEAEWAAKNDEEPGRRSAHMNGHEERMPAWQSWVVAQVAVWALAIGMFQTMFTPMNQQAAFWTRQGAWCLAGLLLLEGTAAWGGVLLLRRLAGARTVRFLQPLFFFWAVLVAANCFPNAGKALGRRLPWLSSNLYYLAIWAAGLALSLAAACFRRGRRLAGLGWRALAWGWVLPPVLGAALGIVSPARAPTSLSPLSLPRAAKGAEAPPPVVLVVVDMVAASEVWDEDGTLAADLPNLAAFAAEATTCTNVIAPGPQTRQSLPNICLQRTLDHLHLTPDGRILWRTADGPDGKEVEVGVHDCPGAVTRTVRRGGGRSMAVSYYLPWMDWFTGDWAWDAASTRCFYGLDNFGGGSRFRDALDFVALVFQQQMFASKSPLAAAMKFLEIQTPAARRYNASVTDGIVAEGEACIRDVLSRGDFALLHLSIPHYPFIFDAQGEFHPRLPQTAESYRGQLVHADRLFGRWMDALRASGLWDESWVLVTSDHGLHKLAWSRAPERHDKFRVPLWVKAPGQHAPAFREDPIRLDCLGIAFPDLWAFAPPPEESSPR